jgi:predicted RNA-binding Zn ribbon-like protein
MIAGSVGVNELSVAESAELTSDCWAAAAAVDAAEAAASMLARTASEPTAATVVVAVAVALPPVARSLSGAAWACEFYECGGERRSTYRPESGKHKATKRGIGGCEPLTELVRRKN